MERGIEDCDMRDFGKLLHRSLDSDQVGGVMQGSELATVFDALNHFLINSHTVFERFPAVHHTVADADNFQAAHLMKNLFKHFDMAGVWQRYLITRSLGEFCLEPGVWRTQAFSQTLDLRFSRGLDQ